MAALSANRDTQARGVVWATQTEFSGTDSTTYYQGGIVCIDQSTGKVVKGSTATGLVCLGRCEEAVVTGTSTTEKIKALSGIFQWGNSSSSDAIAADDIGKTCYIVDDQTVALTDGSASRSAAGVVFDVDSSGVWVSTGFPV